MYRTTRKDLHEDEDYIEEVCETCHGTGMGKDPHHYGVDDWCKRCGVGKTYMESHKYKVRIPWDEYDGRAAS